jgi:hypothetical protein
MLTVQEFFEFTLSYYAFLFLIINNIKCLDTLYYFIKTKKNNTITNVENEVRCKFNNNKLKLKAHSATYNRSL